MFWVESQQYINPGIAAHAYNPRIWDERSIVHDHS